MSEPKLKAGETEGGMTKGVKTSLIVIFVLVAIVLAWTWFSSSQTTNAPRPTPRVAVAAPPLRNTTIPTVQSVCPVRTADASDVLIKDPEAIARETEFLRKQTAASQKSDVGPSSLALPEARIKEIEKKRLILE